jgi:hypothetical protein
VLPLSEQHPSQKQKQGRSSTNTWSPHVQDNFKNRSYLGLGRGKHSSGVECLEIRQQRTVAVRAQEVTFTLKAAGSPRKTGNKGLLRAVCN